jgi:acetate kinase
MSDGLLITLNAGSSSLRIGRFETETVGARRVAEEVIDFRRMPLGLKRRSRKT